MSEPGDVKRNGAPEFKSTVVSRKGAAIRVERIELSEQMKKNLTTSVRNLGVPRAGRTEPK